MSHIRDPKHSPDVLGIEDRRLKIYRELFFNNIKGFLSSAFPVLEQLLGEAKWEHLARLFFSQHNCRSPYFLEISKEFVEYLSNGYELADDDYPFMPELAHYEWIELDLSARLADPNGSVWNGSRNFSNIVFSENAEIVSYQYPVHQIQKDFIPKAPSLESFFFTVCRDAQFDVKFSQINAVTAHLLQLVINAGAIDLPSLQNQLCRDLAHLPADDIRQATQDIVESLLNQQILLIGN